VLIGTTVASVGRGYRFKAGSRHGLRNFTPTQQKWWIYRSIHLKTQGWRWKQLSVVFMQS